MLEILAIPGAYILAVMPKRIAVQLAIKNTGKFNNVEPRSIADNIADPIDQARSRRALAAQENGMEVSFRTLLFYLFSFKSLK